MNESIHDLANQQFVLELENDRQVVVNYVLEDGIMRLVYSKVPAELQGEGIGKILVEKTFQKLTEEGHKAEAVCSYIRIIAKRSERWKRLIKY